MSDNSLVKLDLSAARLVGVVTSPAILARATRLRHPPGFFELRLDALRASLAEVARAIPKLRAPLILAARHPLEGGTGKLKSGERRALLRRFLEHASFVDLELRSLREMNTLIDEIRRRRLDLIISHHDFRESPSLEELRRLAKFAAVFKPAVFKIAIRTDTPDQLARLISFFLEKNRARFPIAAMGIGKLGLESRRALDRLGSALTYVSLGQANVQGQPSLSQLRRARRAYIR
jgi:3-dehydroquinate dehydratase I